MRALHRDLRNELERVVIEARDVAERAAEAALARLAVGEASPYGEMTPEQRELRVELRARGRAVGDQRDARTGRQEIRHLTREMAYQHWHRMLFARFLAENDLLIHPEGVPVTLKECEELAREEGAANGWALAERYAARMLPQIFRPDDPVLNVALAPEHQQGLERLLAQLPADVFRADDSLGWTYQFWQSKRKDEVNASGVKIGADELPAVTQLFTEGYMVQFLLDNTLGPWWAGKYLQQHVGVAEDLSLSEGELRRRVAPEGCSFGYLRFLPAGAAKDQEDLPDRNTPAAGVFEGWPRQAKDLKVIDPCCGSGHFLVAALHKLVPMRMQEEGLSAGEACDAVLAENLYGLEIDPRCTQIAAFALALSAWTYPGAGGYRELPELNIACSGIGPQCSEEEWLALAEQSGIRMPSIGREAIRNGLLNLHRLFSQAPTLGSLIDPTRLPRDLIAADYETIQPFLTAIMSAEEADDETRERAITAAGMVKAADLLASEYTLIVTNVPYLARKTHCDVLTQWADANAPEARNDLATLFVLRCIHFLRKGGTASLVTPQNWFFLTTYGKLRKKLLKTRTLHAAARLGPEAFEAITGHVVNVALSVIGQPTSSATHWVGGVDAQDANGARGKADYLRDGNVTMIPQKELLENPDSRIVLERLESGPRLGEYAHAFQGVSPADLPHYGRSFWELGNFGPEWRPWQSTVERTMAFGGRELVLWWNKDFEDAVSEGVAYVRGECAWGSRGVGIKQMGNLPATIYTGEVFDTNIAIIVPKKQSLVAAVWAYCTSEMYSTAVRKLDRKMNVTNATLVEVPFDLDHWQKVAADTYPQGLPEPESYDPTQWLFHGRPDEAQEGTELQVAVARLLSYRWPAELDPDMELADQARELADQCEELLPYADEDGIVCLPALRGERAGAERLRQMLAAAYGDEWSPAREAELLAAADCEGKPLETWLRDYFFEQHCALFHHRPFIWHIWDGVRSGGFSVLVNYHGLDRRLLERLTYTYLGDWIRRQEDEARRGAAGAEGCLVAAKALQDELKKIIEGEKPYDIFVRWKPIEEQPIGWEPDLNDGVRMNIRPFMMTKDVGRKGAGILRHKPNIKWTKDRGKEPERPQEQCPWFWKDGKFTGNRVNDVHLSLPQKREARTRAEEQNR